MGATATVRQAHPLRRHRIIERHRLLALLEESKARARMLVAPAGYGKTTLAEQWVARTGHQGAWFTTRSASQDVAALALGLARASSVLVPGCDARLREHLRAVPTPAENVEVLAEILGEDFDSWPSDGWLVIDDYQEIVGAREAEHFVAALVAASPVQILIATRQRPSWVTTRGLLYGEVLELNQTALAMDSTEAAEVLGGHESASGLVALANGWPAVIALASVSSAELTADKEQVPESLYRFFAEEVFGALGDDVQEGLGILSLAPVLDRDLAIVLLGGEAEVTCQSALDVGILVERGNLLELHPLARSFLGERRAELGYGSDESAVSRVLDYYLGRRDWDAAFDVIARHRVDTVLEDLLLAALDELLDTARLSTVETWCSLASELNFESTIFALARGEVALRRGRHTEAQAHAEAAASGETTELTFRAFSLAGCAAHLASHEEEALELYRRAEAVAPTETERRDALWGQLGCAVELESREASEILGVLSESMTLSDPREAVRAAAFGLNYQERLGSLDLRQADRAYELLDSVLDPLVVSSFQSMYSGVLGLCARYEEALDVASAFMSTTRRYRLDFAVPYALCNAATAQAGLRQWQNAESQASEAIELARRGRNAHAEQIGYAVHFRVLIQHGRHQAALALPTPELRHALPAARAEVGCTRALGLASTGRVDEAQHLVDGTRGLSRAVEPMVLAAAVRAICALKKRDDRAIDHAVELEATAFATGAVDLLVTSYRSTPELLAVLLRRSVQPDRLFDLLRRAHDEDLASLVGSPIASNEDPVGRLSPREREVHELLTQGLTNRQIASLLFISESTVKVHAHHIYDKLGLRSRTALRIRALLERADQATSATRTSGSTDDS